MQGHVQRRARTRIAVLSLWMCIMMVPAKVLALELPVAAEKERMAMYHDGPGEGPGVGTSCCG
jgi:hypothetical protein